jgi:hypothetical protein
VEGDIVATGAFKKSGIAASVITPDTDSNAYVFLNRALYVLSGNAAHITSKLICDSLEIKDCYFVAYNARTGSYYLCSQVDGLYILTPKNFRSLAILTSPVYVSLNAHYFSSLGFSQHKFSIIILFRETPMLA